eukprot:scaffold9845_cov63-Phaeocystis_antarctica.AAC.4
MSCVPAVDGAVRPNNEREQVVRPHQPRIGPAHLGDQLVAVPPQHNAIRSEEAARYAASDQTECGQPLHKQARLSRRARHADGSGGAAQASARSAQEQAAERGQRARCRSHGVEQVLGAAGDKDSPGPRQLGPRRARQRQVEDDKHEWSDDAHGDAKKHGRRAALERHRRRAPNGGAQHSRPESSRVQHRSAA